jgi:hypothetical protein
MALPISPQPDHADDTGEGDIPLDTFGTRLAIVRQSMGGWNIKRAALECGLDPGSWGAWEKGASPQRREEIARKISDRTRFSYQWLMVGGALRSR